MTIIAIRFLVGIYYFFTLIIVSSYTGTVATFCIVSSSFFKTYVAV
jgi:hypothetical protein